MMVVSRMPFIRSLEALITVPMSVSYNTVGEELLARVFGNVEHCAECTVHCLYPTPL